MIKYTNNYTEQICNEINKFCSGTRDVIALKNIIKETSTSA